MISEFATYSLELDAFELGVIAGLLHKKISEEKKNPDYESYIKVFEKIHAKIREVTGGQIR